MIVPSPFWYLLAERLPRLPDLHATLGEQLWPALPWRRRVWFRVTGRKAEVQRRLGVECCAVSPIMRGPAPAGIRSARMTRGWA